MNKAKTKYLSAGVEVLFVVAIYLFWAIVYPHLLSYQEQNQLFLFSSDYFIHDISVAGGLADYISEFIVQFFYLPWLGAILLAGVYLAMQTLSWSVLKQRNCRLAFLYSFILPLLTLYFMGFIQFTMSYPVALCMALLMVWLAGKKSMIPDIVIIPLLYWAIGPLVWTYTLLRFVAKGWRYSPFVLVTLGSQLAAYYFLLPQYPLSEAMGGINYLQTPNLFVPGMQIGMAVILPLVIFSHQIFKNMRFPVVVIVAMLGIWLTTDSEVRGSIYDKSTFELLRQDYLIRNEKWNDIIANAEKFTVNTPFWSNSVNLALAQTGQLADRQFSFYQSGPNALVMASIRDNTSDFPSMEAFFRLGMVNSSLRYAHDLQESIVSGRKSGWLTKRIAECLIINGQYNPAIKHLNLLKKTIFYRAWACEAETLIQAGNDKSSIQQREKRINAHQVYGKLRRFRLKEDFLYNYGEMDKMFGLLFSGNVKNKMALDYFVAQVLLNGNMQLLQGALQCAQQYGGYYSMPAGYMDAVKCIQAKGNLPGSPYADYVARMRNQ